MGCKVFMGWVSVIELPRNMAAGEFAAAGIVMVWITTGTLTSVTEIGLAFSSPEKGSSTVNAAVVKITGKAKSLFTMIFPRSESY